jgi:hypothetical protein
MMPDRAIHANHTNPGGGGMLDCTRAGACGSVGSCARQVKSRRVESMFDAMVKPPGRQAGRQAGRLCLGVGAELMRRPGRYKGTKQMRCGTGFGTKRQRYAFPETRATNSIAC